MSRSETPSLIEAAADGGFASISVVGLAKNVGKTTTLNHLIAGLSGRPGVKLGVSSAGWDGEAFDSITMQAKPRVFLPAGSLAATTTGCLQRSSLEYSVLETTEFHTPLGEVRIIEARRGGNAEIAGPNTASGLKVMKEKMARYGCTLTIFDGAINRKASSSPEVCDAVILATGMNAGSDLASVLELTAHWISLFSLTRPPEQVPEDFLIHTGSLTDEILEDRAAEGIRGIVVEDHTKLFLTPGSLRRSMKKGLRLFVQKAPRLLGVTINPTSLSGRDVPADELLRQTAEVCAPFPVWDIRGDAPATGEG